MGTKLTECVRSSRNGTAAAGGPAEYRDGDVVLTDIVIESVANHPGRLLATFAEGGKRYACTVEAGRPVNGNATYLLRTPRPWSVRVVEVAFHSEFDEDDTCTCAGHGRRGRCRHKALIRYLLSTEQLPD